MTVINLESWKEMSKIHAIYTENLTCTPKKILSMKNEEM